MFLKKLYLMRVSQISFITMIVISVVAVDTMANTYLHEVNDTTGFYTDVQVGDRIDINYTDTADIHFYIFTQPTACFTCIQSITPIQRMLSAYGRVLVVMYVSTDDQHFIERMRVDNGWTFSVVPDPLRAYQKAYKVKNAPVGIVTDRNGRVLAAGPIGSSRYDWTKLYIDLPTSTAAASSDIPQVRTVSTTILQGSNAIVSSGFQRQLVFVSDSLFVIHATPLRRILTYTYTGTLVRSAEILADSGYVPFAPMLAGTPNRSDAIVLIDVDPVKNKPVLLMYNQFLSGRKILRPEIQHSPHAQYGFFAATDQQNTTITTSVVYANASMREKDKTGSIAWTIHDGVVTSYFQRDLLHDSADLSNYYWIAPWIDQDEIAIIENMSRTVSIANRREPHKVRAVTFSPDTMVWKTGWMSSYRNLQETSTIEQRRALSYCVSNLDRLLKDPVSKEYYVSFYNRLDNGSIDMYITGPLGNDRTRTRYVGRNYLCHGIDNGLLYTTITNNGQILLVTKIL